MQITYATRLHSVRRAFPHNYHQVPVCAPRLKTMWRSAKVKRAVGADSMALHSNAHSWTSGLWGCFPHPPRQFCRHPICEFERQLRECKTPCFAVQLAVCVAPLRNEGSCQATQSVQLMPCCASTHPLMDYACSWTSCLRGCLPHRGRAIDATLHKLMRLNPTPCSSAHELATARNCSKKLVVVTCLSCGGFRFSSARN